MTFETTKKSVSFAEEDSVHEFRVDESIDPTTFWISMEEKEESSRDAKDVGTEVIMNGLAGLLECTYATPHMEAQRCLNEFVRKAGGARGIERVLWRSHHEERKQNKNDMMRSIQETQKYAWKHHWNANKTTERLRDLSLQHSLKARLFARKMGKADEAACRPVIKSRRRGRHCYPRFLLVREPSYEVLPIMGCF